MTVSCLLGFFMTRNENCYKHFLCNILTLSSGPSQWQYSLSVLVRTSLCILSEQGCVWFWCRRILPEIRHFYQPSNSHTKIWCSPNHWTVVMVGLCTPTLGSSNYNTRHRIFYSLTKCYVQNMAQKKGKFFNAKQTYRKSGHWIKYMFNLSTKQRKMASSMLWSFNCHRKNKSHYKLERRWATVLVWI